MQKVNGFESAIQMLANPIRRTLEFLPQNIKDSIEEIRLRAMLPLALTANGKLMFVKQNGTLTDYITRDLVTATADDVNESFLLMCNHSVYAHTEELKEGYIMLKHGNRAGVCGTFSSNKELMNITSINLRIAHEIIGVATELAKAFDGKGMLIAGPPASGKTTLLRDLIRQLSNGTFSRQMRVSVIDSRGELSGNRVNNPVTDLGQNSDVLIIKDKAHGIEMALRTLFPDIIVFDEIGNKAELDKISECFNAGVSIITTAHAGTLEELLKRNITQSLIKSGAISKICMLSPADNRNMQILAVSDILEKEYA